MPKYIVDEINLLGGDISNAYGISLSQLKEVAHLGIGKINVDTDIRLAVTRNVREFFLKNPEMQEDEYISKVWMLMKENPKAFDPRVYLPGIMDTVMYGNIPSDSVASLIHVIKEGVMEVVGTLIVEFGQVGKAPLVKPATLEEMADFYKKEGI